MPLIAGLRNMWKFFIAVGKNTDVVVTQTCKFFPFQLFTISKAHRAGPKGGHCVHSVWYIEDWFPIVRAARGKGRESLSTRLRRGDVTVRLTEGFA